MIDEKRLIEKLNKNSIFKTITNAYGKNIYEIIDELPKVGEWISVKDRLPKLLERVLVYAKYTGQKSKNNFINNDVIATNWRDKHGDFVNMGIDYEVIAWMPLPEPYKGDGKQ